MWFFAGKSSASLPAQAAPTNKQRPLSTTMSSFYSLEENNLDQQQQGDYTAKCSLCQLIAPSGFQATRVCADGLSCRGNVQHFHLAAGLSPKFKHFRVSLNASCINLSNGQTVKVKRKSSRATEKKKNLLCSL